MTSNPDQSVHNAGLNRIVDQAVDTGDRVVFRTKITQLTIAQLEAVGGLLHDRLSYLDIGDSAMGIAAVIGMAIANDENERRNAIVRSMERSWIHGN